LVFLIAYIAAIFYFMSLVYPRQDCPGVVDRPLAVNAAGEQVRMKAQACGMFPRVRTVSLYLIDKDADKWTFLSYAPDGATPHVVWTANDRISVELPSACMVRRMGRLKGTSVDYDIKRVMP
jgi:hypothetical protein